MIRALIQTGVAALIFVIVSAPLPAASEIVDFLPQLRADKIVVDADGRRLYLRTIDTVRLLDADSLQSSAEITPGGTLGDMEYDAQRNRLYVTTEQLGNDRLYVLDGSTLELIAAVPTGPLTRFVGIHRQSNTIYVVATGAGIQIVDGGTLQVVDAIPLPFTQRDVVTSRDIWSTTRRESSP